MVFAAPVIQGKPMLVFSNGPRGDGWKSPPRSLRCPPAFGWCSAPAGCWIPRILPVLSSAHLDLSQARPAGSRVGHVRDDDYGSDRAAPHQCVANTSLDFVFFDLAATAVGLGLGASVTRRARAEIKLAASEARMDRVIAGAQLGVWDRDMTSGISHSTGDGRRCWVTHWTR